MMRCVFVGEGSSDSPLGDIVASLFRRRGVDLRITNPDFGRLPSTTNRDVASKITAALRLTELPVDLFLIHRDADNLDSASRRLEIREAVAVAAPNHAHLPVVPVCMTEAWLLLDEAAIRRVSGNPAGRMRLSLPGFREIERRADPKAILATAILDASGTTGRRRERVASRFSQHRRRLLEVLDVDGPVNNLTAWQQLVLDVEEAISRMGAA